MKATDLEEASKAAELKRFYSGHLDEITDKRHHSPYWLRRYVHRQIHQQFLPFVKAGDSVLDAGCGDGMLSLTLAAAGAHVTGADLSAPNVARAQTRALARSRRPTFAVADIESLPFADQSFDVVISSHVLEHLPTLDRGLSEVRRLTRGTALIAMPTCLSPAAWTLLGGDNYWRPGRRFLYATPFGLARTLAALARGMEGPNEGYGGRREAPHVWRFPWVMRRQIESSGFRVDHFEAGPLVLPYLLHFLPFLHWLQPRLDRLRAQPLIRCFGFGSLAVCSRR